jgi:restriction endonuclease Mrr
MTDPNSRRARSPRVFISYSHESETSEALAKRIAEALSDSGTKAWLDTELKPGSEWDEEIERMINASDYMLVLLTPNYIRSQQFKHEFAAARKRELNARAITVVPVLFEDCEIPPILASSQHIDLRSGADQGVSALVERLNATTRFDLSALAASEFERLVGDLLTALAFDVKQRPPIADLGVDLIATHRGFDPFGVGYRQRFLVECKHYRHGRANLESVQTLINALSKDAENSTGLLVTTGQFTSPVRDWVAEQIRHGTRVRLVDGTELNQLLLQHPDLTRKYQASTT